jgi:CO dehydrogenase nickel-insertion accessory protein CooC1
MIKKTRRILAGARIGIFGKGGAGKSTVTVLVARTMRRLGYEVAVLDADSTNVGLPAGFGLDRPPRALVDHFGGLVFSGGAVTCPVDDPTLLPGADLSLHEIPEELVARTSDGIYLLIAGKMGHRGPGAGCDGPVSKIARDLRIHGNGEDPVTVVDFKAGFEDPARGVLTSLDWAVVVIDPTQSALQMAADMKRTIEQIQSGIPPATDHLDSPELVAVANRHYRESRIRGVLCVLNRIPDHLTELFLCEQLAENSLEAIGAIPSDPSITDAWLRGVPLDAVALEGESRRIAEGLESASRGESRPASMTRRGWRLRQSAALK